ncbi:MAG: glycosyltransferase family 4 protein [Chloroflexaceae bacterium]|nr:glycosyltransferase family 4 protein [Chloroflexaceae bacterium]
MLCYIAYPTSLTLQSANALQTYTTMRELRQHRPDMLALIAHWGRGPSRFREVGALHLPRPALGKLSRLYPSSLWYYLEYSTFAWMCAPIIAAQRVDAIYVRQNICAAWWSSVFGPRLNIPVVYEAHDLELRNPSRAREPWAQGWVHMIDRLALTRSTAVVSLTEQFRRYLDAIDWRRPDEVFVVPDAYDDTLFVPHDRAAGRAALGLPPDGAIVCYAGMTFAHRWLDGLLEAAARLVAAHPRLLVVLVGGRPAEIEALRQQARMLGIGEHVHCTGPCAQDDVVRALSAADVLVIPDTLTDMTASPLKLFEYLALGQPLVLPNLPALHEIVPAALAHYFPRRSLDGLVRALDAALCDPATGAATAGRRAIARQHTYGRRAERILKVVDGVVQRKNQQRQD